MVGLEKLVGLSTGVQCSLKRSLSLRLVSPNFHMRRTKEPLLFRLGLPN